MMQLYHREWGTRERPTLLLLHGFMGSGADWQPLAERLADNFYVVAPDLPGHGRSLFADSAEYCFPQTAQAIIKLLNSLSISQCNLLGYSMGGRLALYLAAHFPQRFTKLVLESSSPGIANAAERAARKKWDSKIAEQLTREPFPIFLKQWYTMALFASFRVHPKFEEALARRVKNDPQQLAKSMREMGTGSQLPLWEAWERLELETLLIVGELDAKYVGISAEMAQLNAYAQVRIVERAGHNVHFERLDDYVELVEEFLIADDAG